MLNTLRNIWKVADLRKKVIFTLFIILFFRVGAAVPVPFLDSSVLQAAIDLAKTNTGGDTILTYFNTLSGGAFEYATLFAMSVTPYINASIIIQLLTIAIPPLERLAKEGEEGRKKIGQITRYVTIVLGLVQGGAYYVYLHNNYVEGAGYAVIYRDLKSFEGIFSMLVIIFTFTAGSALMMWLGEQINQKGVGNGISILLFAGIVSRAPDGIAKLYMMLVQAVKGGVTKYFFFVPLVVILFLGIIAFIVFMDNAERRIPVQYAKRVVGRKMYGGQSTHIPIKINMSGVMPIIFASSIVSIPSTFLMFMQGKENSFWYKFLSVFRYDGWVYPVLYFLLILAFAYFYVAIQYNPTEMANNLRKNSGVIPGIRPGKPTADFIQKIIHRITLIGALFLSVIAILPIVLGSITGVSLAVGGTSVMILVGVALETVRQMESQMLMRHYKGFLD